MRLKDYKCVRQDNVKDCGISALLTIINYYKGDISKEDLMEMTNTTTKGVDLYSIANAAKKIGFDAAGVKGDINNISKDFIPCIAHVIIKERYKHFIVIFEINLKKKYLIIGDPSSGVKKISFDYFEKISTHYFLLLKPIKDIPKLNSSKKIKDYIFDNILFYKNTFLFILIISLFLLLFSIISNYNFKFLLDKGINYKSYNNAYKITLVMLVIVFLKNICNYLKNKLINYLDNNLSKDLLLKIYNHLILLPYLYCKRHTTGEIITRITDIVYLKDFISKSLIEFIINIFISVISFLIIFNINRILSFISLAFIFLYLLVSIIYDYILSKYISKEQLLNNKVNTHIIETFEGIDTIKNLNLEKNFYNNLNIKYTNLLSNNYLFFKYYNCSLTLKNIIKDVNSSFLLLVGIILVIDNRLDISSLIVFVSLENYFSNSVKSNIDLRKDFIKVNYCYKRVKDLLKVRREKFVDSTSEIIKSIEIKGLSYSYDYNKKVLSNINLEIKKGERVLLIGPSGNGKSTLIKILLKYLDIDNNKVFINGVDINIWDLSYIRNNICYISQNEIIFTDSIINNIIMKRNIKYEEFLKIVNLTLVDEIINKNNMGYNLLLEENGFNLSGGERQRIILARSILKSASIYVLDESLGEVDVKKERIILKNLFRYYKDKIFIVISHRNDNKDLFTKTIKLDEGKIIYE